jgi:hypothetical protein
MGAMNEECMLAVSTQRPDRTGSFMCRPLCNGTTSDVLSIVKANPEAWSTILSPPCGATLRARAWLFVTACVWVDVATWVFFNYWYRYILAGMICQRWEARCWFCLTFIRRVRSQYLPQEFVCLFSWSALHVTPREITQNNLLWTAPVRFCLILDLEYAAKVCMFC